MMTLVINKPPVCKTHVSMAEIYVIIYYYTDNCVQKSLE